MIFETILLCVMIWFVGFVAGTVFGFTQGRGHLQLVHVDTKIKTEDLYPKRGEDNGSDTP